MIAIKAEHCAAAYDLLRVLPPFNKWKLPPASEVRFRVVRTEHQAEWYMVGEKHCIDVSAKKHTHIHSLVMTVAHEMLHVHQRIKGSETKAEHNAEFHRLAKRVCLRLGFDPGQF